MAIRAKLNGGHPPPETARVNSVEYNLLLTGDLYFDRTHTPNTILTENLGFSAGLKTTHLMDKTPENYFISGLRKSRRLSVLLVRHINPRPHTAYLITRTHIGGGGDAHPPRAFENQGS